MAKRPPPAPDEAASEIPSEIPAEIPSFRGFADAEGRFWKALARNQDRAWFAAHKHEYEDGWATPMRALLHAVRVRVDDDFPYHEIAEPRIFRIQRDVRFSKDKSPYKTNVSGVLHTRGRGAHPITEVPAVLYMHVGLEVMVAAGLYMMDAPTLARFRAALVDEARGAELDALLAPLEREGCTVMAAESLKKVPRGFPDDHPRARLLRMKGLAVVMPEPPRALLASPALVDRLVEFTRRAAPLTTWLATHATA